MISDPKIVLINPPNPFLNEPAMDIPLGLCHLSSYLKAGRIDNIKLIDFNILKYDYYEKEYLKEIPIDGDIYGITCVTPQYKWLVEISDYIRSKNKEAFVVAGGPHPSNMPEECLEDCNLDYVVKGDGESAFLNIVFEKIHGTKKLNSVLSDQIEDINTLPPPDRSLSKFSDYHRTISGERAFHLTTLRGCPYNCAFCDRGSVGRVVRYRHIEYVMYEIDNLIDSFGVKNFVIYDDIFTLNRERLYDFCKQFKKRDVRWRCWSRTDTLDRDKLEIMKGSGLTSITVGVESGDDDILKNINKMAKRADNRDALLLCRALDIPVRCSLMYANPGENRRTLQNTIDLIDECQPDEWNLAVLSPIPGSDIWNNPDRYGISFDKESLHKNYYQQCNRFSDTGIGDPYISISTMTDEELRHNLIWFIGELERVCPRKKIQDTIQDIKV